MKQISEIVKWELEADGLTEEMEEYARNYECKKCTDFYCAHMLNARTKKFKKQIDNELDSFLVINLR